MNSFQETIRRGVVILVGGLLLFGLYSAWKEGVIKLGFDGHRTPLEVPER